MTVTLLVQMSAEEKWVRWHAGIRRVDIHGAALGLHRPPDDCGYGRGGSMLLSNKFAQASADPSPVNATATKA